MPWPKGVNVYVGPRQIDSADIIRIVVRRDGTIVEPLSSQLAVEILTTRAGTSRALHSGSVTYAVSVFAPGATVSVTAIPETGTNITRVRRSEELGKIL